MLARGTGVKQDQDRWDHGAILASSGDVIFAVL